MPSAGGITAGKAFVVIEALDKTGTILNRISRNVTNWAGKMESHVSGIMNKVFMAAIPTAFAMNAFKQFDDSQKRLEARTTGTAKELQTLRDQARAVGKEMGFSAVEVSKLQEELGTLGFSRSQVAEMTPSVARFARAAGSGNENDTQLAAQAVGGAIYGFGLEAKDTAKVVDVLAQAANASSISLEDFNTILSYGSTVAKTFSVSIEDVMSVMALFRNLNLDASTSATAFRNMLLEMSDPAATGKFNEQLATLTGRTIAFADAAGNLKPVTSLLFQIGEAMKGLGTGQQGSLMTTLFGKRAIVPAMALSQGANPFGQLQGMMHNAGGVAALATAKMESGIGGAWRRFTAGMESMAITIGEILQPALIDLSDKVVKLMGDFSNWAMANRETIAAVAIGATVLLAYAASVGTVALTMKLLAATVAIVGTVCSTVAIAFAVLTSPIGIATAAVVGLVGAIMAFKPSIFSPLVSGIQGIGSAFSEVGATVGATMQGMVTAVASGNLTAAWEVAMSGLTLAWFQTVDTLTDVWSDFVAFFTDAWTGAVAMVEKVFLQSQKFLSTFVLELAKDEGMLGDTMDILLGVDVSETAKRGKAMGHDPVGDAQRGMVRNYNSRISSIEDETGKLLDDRAKNRDAAMAARDAETAKRKEEFLAKMAEINKAAQDTRDKMTRDLAEAFAAPKRHPHLEGFGADFVGPSPVGDMKALEGLQIHLQATMMRAYENTLQALDKGKGPEVEALEEVAANINVGNGLLRQISENIGVA